MENTFIMIRILAFLFSIFFVVACNNEDAQSKTKRFQGSQKIRFIKIEKSNTVNSIEALGSFVFFAKADVGSKIEGRVTAIWVKEGQYVKRGQYLARLEKLQYELAKKNAYTELLQARNRLKMAEIAYKDAKRNVIKQISSIETTKMDLQEKQITLKDANIKLSNTIALFKAGGATKRALDKAVNDKQSAELSLQKAKKNLEMQLIGFRKKDLNELGFKGPFTKEKFKKLQIQINTAKEKASITAAKNEILKAKNNLQQANIMLKETTIIAPISGFIAQKKIYLGEQVKKNEPFFTIIDTSRLYATLSVSENDINHIDTSKKVKLIVDALQKKEFHGQVSLVHPLVDPKTRSVTIKVIVNNYQNQIRTGMFARGFFKLKKKQSTFLIPIKSLVKQSKNMATIATITNGRLYFKKIQTGKITGDNIALLTPLPKGFPIAVAPATDDEIHPSQLSEGTKVIPVWQTNKNN